MLWNYAAQLNLHITLSFIDTFNFEYGVLSEKAMSGTMVLRTVHSCTQASIVKRAVQFSDIIHYFDSAFFLIFDRAGISAHAQ